MTIKTVMNWSSGKDAALAYYYLLQEGKYEVTRLLTTISAEYKRVFMHGVMDELLHRQAEMMGLPVTTIPLPASPNDELYKAAMLQTFAEFRKEGIEASAFGDIFLEDLKTYREEQLKQVHMQAVFPLWKKDTRTLIDEIEAVGIEAVTVCISEKHLPKEFLGRKIGRQFLADLPEGVDPCGENGEFHSFVYNAPYFKEPVAIKTGAVVHKTYTPSNDGSWNSGFYFLDVMPAEG
jgi:uncharacterized protein (TIGR00290 family)